MDTLPQLPRSSSSYLLGQDTHVDVSFYDGRFTDIRESQTLPRGFDYSAPTNMAHSHAGSQEYFNGPPLIDTRAWESLSRYPSENFPCNSPLAPDHWQYSHSLFAGHEYPTSDNYMAESTQSEWTTTPIDAHQCTPFVLCPPSPSVPRELHVPLSVELHQEDRASDDTIFRCPLLSSDGTCCNALIPCNEARITAHLRTTHALRAKRFEVISCLWPGCMCSMQAASIPRHIITLHVKTRFQCSYCGKSLTRKDGKLKHEKICHEKP
ncbi:uncharacterized protein EDB93DRAFT_169069 [Suillus bovinus]|uniref:uncharacterized protein n=1 Tax=Suillus bovinus TaxID=48563 RepID=UPI001B86065B|nr:uncharacterized protein EDB93DRAFT_169069 [Suillus bovinus]KAG2128632.1 hypothetical protein EDB93DRAFT_169069 [Suillus bovinus]